MKDYKKELQEIISQIDTAKNRLAEALAKVCYYGTKAVGDEGFFAEKYPDFSTGNRGCSVRPVCMAGAAWYLRKKDEKDQNQD